jgi:hypothetical protein
MIGHCSASAVVPHFKIAKEDTHSNISEPTDRDAPKIIAKSWCKASSASGGDFV